LLGLSTKTTWYSSFESSGDLLNFTIFWFLKRTDWLMFSSGWKEFLASWTGGKHGLDDLLENVTSFRLILLHVYTPIESFPVSKSFQDVCIHYENFSVLDTYFDVRFLMNWTFWISILFWFDSNVLSSKFWQLRIFILSFNDYGIWFFYYDWFF
jgi:hypothetical protein